MGKVLQAQEIQGSAPVGDVVTESDPSLEKGVEYENFMARQSMLALNQQLAAEGYDENSYGSDQFKSTMSQDLSGENTYDQPVTDFTQSNITKEDVEQAYESGGVTSEYNNVLARFVGTIAQFVGEDTTLGAKLKSMADDLDAGSSSGTYDPENPYHNLNNPDVLNGADDASGIESSDQSQAGDVSDGLSNPDPDGLTAHNVDFMSKKADEDVVNGEFLKAGQATDDKPFEAMRSATNSICNDLTDDMVNNMVGVDAWDENSPQKQDSSYKHMSFMRGLAAYSEQAVSGIDTMFQDDPEGKETAMRGLDGMMAASVPQAFDTIYSNNKNFQFLTDSDRAELDSMQFSGVDITYSEYEAKRMEQDGITVSTGYDMSAEDADMYANAGLDDFQGDSYTITEGSESDGVFREGQEPAAGGAIGGVGMGADPYRVSSGAAKGAVVMQPGTGIQSAVGKMTKADRIAIADKMAAEVENAADSTKGYGLGE